MSKLTLTDPTLFFTKNDLDDLRLGDFVESGSGTGLFWQQNSNPKNNLSLHIMGYPDDEGIRLNGGRAGAAFAPFEIRRFFYKMTPQWATPVKILDAGDVPTDITLNQRHSLAQKIVQGWCQNNFKWISLGGGHDYAYADGAGFISANSAKPFKPLIINIDAHLDVRPYKQQANSGTAFYRLLTDFHHKFDLFEYGLQPQCNSMQHRQWALKKGAQIIDLSDCKPSLYKKWQKDFSGFKNRSVFLSVDIDAFKSSEAPGCSQSWATGLKIEDFLQSLKFLITHFEVMGLGIYEVSPPLDQDNRTSKLAALIMYHFIYQQVLKHAGS